MKASPLKLLALAVAALALGSAPNVQPGRAGGFETGQPFASLADFGLEGALPDLKGKVVLLDFWASWCPPCKASFSTLNELHQRYGDKGVVILAVNVDEKKAAMESFLKKTPANFAVVRDAQQKLVAAAKIETMPTSLIIDRDGKLRFAHKGFKGPETAKQYAQELDALLGAE